MKRIICLIAICFSLFFPALMHGSEVLYEHISSFNVELRIEKTGKMHVHEVISYDSGSLEKHGIFRYIPYEYKNPTRLLSIDDISVTDEKGVPMKFTTYSEGGNEVIKIGDPNVTFHGPKTFTIDYTVSNVVNVFPGHDEIYWNAVGSRWPFSVEAASVTVLSEASAGGFKRVACYVGEVGSMDQGSCTVSDMPAIEAMPDGKRFVSKISLFPGQDMSVVLGFAPGTFPPPTLPSRVLQLIRMLLPFALPLIVFPILFMLWLNKGRDQKHIATVVPEYDVPKDLTPFEAGVIVDEKVDSHDITSEIIYLAQQGFITIEPIEKTTLGIFTSTDYRIRKVKPGDDRLSILGNQLMRSFFYSTEHETNGVLLSEVKKMTSLAIAMQSQRSEIFKVLTEKGYFVKGSRSLGTVVGVVGTILGIIFFGLIFVFTTNFIILLSAFVTYFVMVSVFAKILTAKTAQGVDVVQKLKGLRMYMQVAEKDRIAFHNPPTKTFDHFLVLLPWAIMLGVDKAWAKQFEGMEGVVPWYIGTGMHAFSASSFTSNLGNFNVSFTSTTTASSGGSGFSGGGSGGGFGGGGGGSW